MGARQSRTSMEEAPSLAGLSHGQKAPSLVGLSQSSGFVGDPPQMYRQETFQAKFIRKVT